MMISARRRASGIKRPATGAHERLMVPSPPGGADYSLTTAGVPATIVLVENRNLQGIEQTDVKPTGFLPHAPSLCGMPDTFYRRIEK